MEWERMSMRMWVKIYIPWLRDDLEKDPETGYADEIAPKRLATPFATSSCDAFKRCNSLLVDAIRRATE